ncbi:MAG: DUF3997 domain-containing protein [Muribaculaceae bacterium]|nr:DUF3997 domain-containing protein [Muribaculaceae bacterium]
MKLRHLIISILSLIMIGFSAGCRHDIMDLGNNYFWVDGAIFYESADSAIHKLIFRSVIEANYDNNFIIAKQIPRKEFNTELNEWYSNNRMVKDSVRRKLEKALSIGTCYWIIDKKHQDVLGPMRRAEFDCARESLGISINLTK